MDYLGYVLGFRHFCEQRCAMHSHRHFELVYHMSGEGVTSLKTGEEFQFRKDTVIIYRPKVVHNQVMLKEGEDACISFSVEQQDDILQDIPCIVLPRLSNTYLQSEILRMTEIGDVRLLSQQKKLSLDLRLTALINDILELISEHSEDGNTTTEASVKLAYDYISENFRELKSVESIALHVGLSYDYLRHQFKKTYGISMIQHLLNSKISYAKQLLKYTPLPQKQIAEECGFSNIRYFNSAFKKAVKQTPGKFRK